MYLSLLRVICALAGILKIVHYILGIVHYDGCSGFAQLPWLVAVLSPLREPDQLEAGFSGMLRLAAVGTLELRSVLVQFSDSVRFRISETVLFLFLFYRFSLDLCVTGPAPISPDAVRSALFDMLESQSVFKTQLWSDLWFGNQLNSRTAI